MAIEPNALFHCDCITLLERIGSKNANLVYLDPPWYPTESTSTSTRSTYKQHLEVIAKVAQQSFRILSDSGSLFFHTDPHLASTFRLILDQIFLNRLTNNSNFVGEYICPRRPSSRSLASKTQHSTILHYSKTSNYVANKITRPFRDEEVKYSYKMDEEGRKYILSNLISPLYRESNSFAWQGYRPPVNRSWKFRPEKLQELLQQGKIYFPSTIGLPLQKVFLDEKTGVEVGSVWDDIQTTPVNIRERVKTPNQQSLALLNRILSLGSSPADLVVDPFCGSGTTLISAQINNRKWLGCDNDSNAIATTINRLEEHRQSGNYINYESNSSEELEQETPANNKYHQIVTSIAEANPTVGVMAMIFQGQETQTLEFKSAACWNEHNQVRDTAQTDKITETITSFMNSVIGGTVLVGVSDNGHILGLRNDFRAANATKNNRDGYQLYLQDKISDALGVQSSSYYSVSFHKIDGEDICEINVSPSSKPVFFKEDFYGRVGNQTCKFKAKEAYEYINIRWAIEDKA